MRKRPNLGDASFHFHRKVLDAFIFDGKFWFPYSQLRRLVGLSSKEGAKTIYLNALSETMKRKEHIYGQFDWGLLNADGVQLVLAQMKIGARSNTTRSAAGDCLEWFRSNVIPKISALAPQSKSEPHPHPERGAAQLELPIETPDAKEGQVQPVSHRAYVLGMQIAAAIENYMNAAH